MTSGARFPKIKSVQAQAGLHLLVEFENGVSKLYDCSPLLAQMPSLADPSFFALAHPDPHGYGVIWDDETDLAESEIWIHGKDVPVVPPVARSTGS